MPSELVRCAQTPLSEAPKRSRKSRSRKRDPAVALWELLPDELVRRIVGFVRQGFLVGVHPSMVSGTRALRHFKGTRLHGRAFANGLHSIAMLSVPTYHPDHVDAFTEGLVRLACDLFNQAQQEELGNAHVSFKCDFPEGQARPARRPLAGTQGGRQASVVPRNAIDLLFGLPERRLHAPTHTGSHG